MRSSRSHSSAKPAHNWARRHRQQHAAFKRGKVLPLDERTSKRFAWEFEAALRERGAAAAMLAQHKAQEAA